MYNNNWNHHNKRNYSQIHQSSYNENYGNQGGYQDVYDDNYTAPYPENSQSYQYHERGRQGIQSRGRGSQYERQRYTADEGRNDTYFDYESIAQNREEESDFGDSQSILESDRIPDEEYYHRTQSREINAGKMENVRESGKVLKEESSVNVKQENASSEADNNMKEEVKEGKNEESDSDDDDDDETTQAIKKLPAQHSKGLMSTLIALNGPQALNRKPDPLPPPQPMKLETDEEKYLKENRPIDTKIFLDYGITENMLEEANLEIEDVPCNVRDLLPTDIGKDVDKPELFCKLCQVQTTSIGNFRDHLNGKSHKNAFENFRQGKKVSTKKKKAVIDPSDVGQKSVSMEMVEGLLEPILGLSYITEYHSISGIQCVCNLCGVKFDRNIVVSHVTGSKHRLHYMKEKKPHVYLHLKKFGGRKSQLSAFLDELSMDAEKEDGRGVPTIKIFEPDNSEEAQDENIAGTTEAALESKRHEALLARRKPGNISFQDWVNEEFNKLKTNDSKRSPSPSGAGFGHTDDDIPVNSGTQRHNPVYNRRVLNDLHGPMHAPYDPYLENLRHPPPFLDSHRPRPFYPFTEPFPIPGPMPPGPIPPIPLRRDPYFNSTIYTRLSYPEPYLDPDPYKGIRRVETDLDPDPLKRIPPKTDTVMKDKIVIDYGHGSSNKTNETDFRPKSILKNKSGSDSGQLADQNKPSSDQWERDILQILGQNKNVKAPDSLAMLSSTYSSPEKSPSPNRGSEQKKRRELPFSKSYLETNKLKDLKLERELPFSKSYLESNKLKDSTSHRDEETSDKPSSSRINLYRSGHIGSKSPDLLQHKPTHTKYKSRSPEDLKHNYNRNKIRDHELGAHRARSPAYRMGDRKKHLGDGQISQPGSWNNRSRIARNNQRENTYRSKEHIRAGIGHQSNDINFSMSSKHLQSRRSPPYSLKRTRPSRSPPYSSKHPCSRSPPYSSKPPQSSRSPPYSSKHPQSSRSPPYSSKHLRSSRSPPYSSKYSRSSRSPPYSSKHPQSSRSPPYSSEQQQSSSLSLKRRHSRTPESSVKYQRSKSPQEVIKEEYSNSPESKRHESNRHSRLIQDILSEPDAELQAERIADLLLQMSSTLTEEGDANTAIQKLLTNSEIKEALLATKTKPVHRNDPPPREKVAFSLSGYRGQTKSSTLPSDFGESDDESS